VNILFYASQKDREIEIARAFSEGVIKSGDECRITATADIEGVDSWADVAAMVGIKGWSRLLMDTYLAAGKHVIILDKCYLYRPGGTRSKYLRVSIDALQPHAYFQNTPRPSDRLERYDIKLRPYDFSRRQHIIIAGGSLKYAEWHHMNSIDGRDPMTSWARTVVHKLQGRTVRPLVYRPKPSWQDAVPIEGTRFSRPPTTISEELERAFALVTYGSNAAVDAVIAGVGVFVLGDGIALRFSRNFKDINTPYVPSDEERWQFLCDLSYCQFDLKEFEHGFAWRVIRPQIEGMETNELPRKIERPTIFTLINKKA